MWKKQLRQPIYFLVRRTLAPISDNQTLFFSNFSSLHASNGEVRWRISQIPRNLFQLDSICSRKSFSSEPAVGKGHCWNCNSPVPFMFCQSCHSVQPVDHSVDFFQIFGLEKKFEVEDGSLEGKYKDWQKKLHPDLVHTKSEKEREYAAEQSARVIDAYSTLRNPLSRALYIMRLEGVEVDEEKTISDGELLAEIMEIREAVEEAVDTQVLDQIKTQMRQKLRHWSDSFANAFQSKNYDEALRSIQRMTYYNRVNEEIVKKL